MPSSNDFGEVIVHLKKFKKYNLFKRRILSIIAGFLSHSEKIPLEILFKQLDKDKDGIISFPEFKYVAK